MLVLERPSPEAGRLVVVNTLYILSAASLVLGIFVGSTDQGRVAAQSVGVVAGISLSTTSVQMTALDEALQTQDDEELL